VLVIVALPRRKHTAAVDDGARRRKPEPDAPGDALPADG
jgi:hypothetical protein